MRTSSLLFACIKSDELPAVRRAGLDTGIELDEVLEYVSRRCDDCILAIDRFTVSSDSAAIRPDSIRNIRPYLKPTPVIAAGGFVIRRRSETLQLLLIYRRGTWDLPKGKLDEGETIEQCARREVCEELGIDEVNVVRPLGQTVHGYPDGDSYAVKTTHWFAMSTNATSFEPQEKEDIEEAEWVDLAEARERLGFETLRRHLDEVSDLVSEL